jgi:hypothetical protein
MKTRRGPRKPKPPTMKEEAILLMARALDQNASFQGDMALADRLIKQMWKDGFAIVPIKLTAPMLMAYDDLNWSPEAHPCEPVWAALLAASPLRP